MSLSRCFSGNSGRLDASTYEYDDDDDDDDDDCPGKCVDG